MPDDLQIRENTRFQERVWKIQPVIWILMLLFVAVGFLGTFGGAGPLNQTTLQAPPIKIEYERFPINTIPTAVTVQLDTDAASTAKFDLWLDNDYLTRMILKHTYPEPEKSESRDSGTVFTFSATEGKTATISLIFEPHDSGRVASEYRIEGVGSVNISHLVYP